MCLPAANSAGGRAHSCKRVILCVCGGGGCSFVGWRNICPTANDCCFFRLFFTSAGLFGNPFVDCSVSSTSPHDFHALSESLYCLELEGSPFSC